jgi:glycosyltransferase involved in cell wall biosynthesis
LAGALKKLIVDADLRRSLGEKGLASVRAYDWPLVAQRILDYYEQVARSRDVSKNTTEEQITAGVLA